MPKLKRYKPGKRVNIWIPDRHIETWEEIENKSAFVSVCLSDFVGIMAWAIARKADPERFNAPRPPKEPTLKEFNKQYPLDELTKRRLNKECSNNDNSPNKPELW